MKVLCNTFSPIAGKRKNQEIGKESSGDTRKTASGKDKNSSKMASCCRMISVKFSKDGKKVKDEGINIL